MSRPASPISSASRRRRASFTGRAPAGTGGPTAASRTFLATRSRNAARRSALAVSTPYMAIQRVRASGWHTARNVRRTMRLPASPSTALTNFDEPCVVTTVMRRTLRRRAWTRLDSEGRSNATSRTQTRSIQPFSMAGGPLHHVG